MVFSVNTLIPAIPEIFITVMACLVLLLGVFVKRSGALTYWLSQLSLITAAVLSAMLYNMPVTTALNNMFILDPMASLLKLFVYLSTSFCFLYAWYYNKDRNIANNEFYVLGLFAVLGTMVMVSANNLLIVFLGLELLSLPIYAMVAMQRNSPSSSEAAIKYFVMGSLASGMLLYGLSLLYGATGSLALPQIAQSISVQTHNILLDFAIVFIVAGLAFKMGAAPFHLWAPDVYQGAPTSVTVLISSAPKLAVIGILIRLLADTMPSLHIAWQQLLICIAVVSMGLGNIIAIAQSNLKRMLAYSAISQMGYMLLGILAGTKDGYAASLFYLIAYTLMATAAFGTLIMLSKQGFEAETFEDLRGLNVRSPWLAFMLLLVMFSMAGIPPTVGFFAKLGVLQALIKVDIVWLAVAALLFAIIGAYYYLRVVKMMYFDEPINNDPIINRFDSRLAISLNGLLVLALGMFPSFLLELCRHAFI